MHDKKPEYFGGADAYKDEAYRKMKEQYPQGVWVYLRRTKQLGMVEEVRPSADGPRVRVKHIGTVPAAELRLATEEEIRLFK